MEQHPRKLDQGRYTLRIPISPLKQQLMCVKSNRRHVLGVLYELQRYHITLNALRSNPSALIASDTQFRIRNAHTL